MEAKGGMLTSPMAKPRIAGAFGSIVFPDAEYLADWAADRIQDQDAIWLGALGKAGSGAVVSSLLAGASDDGVCAVSTRGSRATLSLALNADAFTGKGLEALAGVAAAQRHGGKGRLVLFVGDQVTHQLLLLAGTARLVKGNGPPVGQEKGYAAYCAAIAAARAGKPGSSAAKPAKTKPARPKAATSTLEPLDRARTWSKPRVLAAFAEHGAEVVAHLAELVARRDLLKTGVAYSTLSEVLFHLVVNPRIDAGPLLPLLEPIVRFPSYNPDKLRQFEYIRTLSMRLLARAGHPAARRRLVQVLEDFPEPLTDEGASSYLYALAEIATELGDKTLAPLFAPLLQELLPKHGARQRENALGDTRELVAKLARRKARQ